MQYQDSKFGMRLRRIERVVTGMECRLRRVERVAWTLLGSLSVLELLRACH